MSLAVVYLNELVLDGLFLLLYSFTLRRKLLALKFLHVDLLAEQVLDLVGSLRICFDVLTVFVAVALILVHVGHVTWVDVVLRIASSCV